MLQNNFLSLRVLQLIFLYDILLRYRLHCKQILGSFLFHQQHSPESSLAQHDLGDKIVDCDFLLEIFGKQSFGRFPYDLFFLLLLHNILLV